MGGIRQKVFITGASSGLMTQVASFINPDKYELVGLSRRSESVRGNNLRWIKGDLLKPEIYRDELKTADMILHGAAQTHSKDASEYFRVNVEGTRMLLDVIPADRKPLFVLISSRVAGKDSGAYGESKLEAEKLVKEKQRDWIVIRPAEIFGGSKNEGIDSTIMSAISGGVKPCPVGMKSKLYPIHQSDAAKAIHEAVFEQNRVGETVNINGPKGYSYMELLELVGKVSGKQVFAFPVPRFVLSTASIISSVLKINVGFVPDQVKRLYSKKEHGPAPKTTISLAEYIKERSRG